MNTPKPIDLNDLPKFSPWIEIILGLKNLGRNLEKNPESIEREYGNEKWGRILEDLRATPQPGLKQADDYFIKDVEVAYFHDGQFFAGPAPVVHDIFYRLVRDELSASKKPFNHIVELGAGYGTIILKLAEEKGFSEATFTGAEYTKSGIEAMKILAKKFDKRFTSGYCDLSQLDVSELKIPQNAVFMTSWAMPCVQGFSKATMKEIIAHQPEYVIHFEPVAEFFDEKTLTGMLWKRYIQINNYNQTMYTDLKKFEAEGLIKIIEEKKNVFGQNPLMPVSVIKWKPC